MKKSEIRNQKSEKHEATLYSNYSTALHDEDCSKYALSVSFVGQTLSPFGATPPCGELTNVNVCSHLKHFFSQPIREMIVIVAIIKYFITKIFDKFNVYSFIETQTKKQDIRDTRQKLLPTAYCLLLTFLFSSCEKEPTKNNQLPDAKTQKVWIVNEGLYNFGNASLDIYLPDSQKVYNDVYNTANGKTLGDVGQSIVFKGNSAYVTVNNSGKIVVLNKTTFKEEGVINIPQSSPRYLHFVKDDLAFVTELYAKKIWLINPLAKTVLDTISTAGWTEQIAAKGNELFIAQRTRLNDTYTANVIVVNVSSKKITHTISLPTEPNSIVIKDNTAFVLCSEDASLGKNASLVKINTETKTIEATLDFAAGKKPGLLRLDGKNNRLLWRDGDVFQMPVSSAYLAANVLISGSGKNIYAINIDPKNADIYLSDAHDYIQASTVYRHAFNGDLIQSFKAGIIAAEFGFE